MTSLEMFFFGDVLNTHNPFLGIDMNMTNSNDRLDRLEALVETLGQRVDGITAAVAANQQQIATAFEAIDRLANVQLQLAQIVDNERQTVSTTLASISAALERQDRILDYLMRRDRDGNGDRPPQ